VLSRFCDMGADATDPIEPPPQGDVLLRDVRRDFGRQLTLFGNIEASAIETLKPDVIVRRVAWKSGEHGTSPKRKRGESPPVAHARGPFDPSPEKRAHPAGAGGLSGLTSAAARSKKEVSTLWHGLLGGGDPARVCSISPRERSV